MACGQVSSSNESKFLVAFNTSAHAYGAVVENDDVNGESFWKSP